MKSRLVVSGAFSLHLLHSVFEDLFVAHICLDEMFEARNHSLGFLIKLKHSRGSRQQLTKIQQRQTQRCEMKENQ